jgi:acetoin utilization protein AcuB
MFVRNHILPTSQIVSLTENQTLGEALEIMLNKGHDALPVLRDQFVVGVLSKQHIYKTFFLKDYPSKNEYLNSTFVREEMKIDFRTIRENEILEDALFTMSKMRMQFLTVLDAKGRFAGLLTKQNLLQTFANSLGMGKRGTRVELVLDDIEGRLASLTRLIAKVKINIISIIMVDPSVMELRKVVLRLDTKEKDSIVETLDRAGFRVLHAYLED